MGILTVSYYLFCIVVVEENATQKATYDLHVRFFLVCLIFMILQFLLTISAAWYLKRKYSGSYKMLMTIANVHYYTCNYYLPVTDSSRFP